MRTRIILGITGVVSLAGLLCAQGPADPQDRNPRGQIDVNVLNVPLMVSVTDNKGKHITNLVKDDFRIFEDGKQQTIRTFTRETDLPLSIALLVDSSGSVIEQIKFEQAAAIDFFFNTMKRKKDRAIVIGFDSIPRV